METKSLVKHIDENNLEIAFQDAVEFYNECTDFYETLVALKAQYSRNSFEEIHDKVGRRELSVDLNRIRFSLRKIVRDFQENSVQKHFDVGDFHDELEGIENQDRLLIKIIKIRLEPMGYQIPESVHPDKNGKCMGIIRGKNSIFIPIKKMGSSADAVAKVLSRTSLDVQEKKNFQNLLGIKHRNIIKVLDTEVNLYPFFLIKEYIYGTKLDISIQKTGKRPVSQVIDWLYRLSDAILYLSQKNIHHFNIRPSKIYIDEEFQVMLSPVDLFGSRLSNEGSKVEITNFWDVCRYGSPELLKNYSPTNTALPNTRFVCAAEQFSLGLIAYYALTGEELFSGNTVQEILENRKQFEANPETKLKNLERLPKFSSTDENLFDIIRKLLKINPEDRYSHMHDLIRDLHRLIYAELEDALTVQKSYRRALANNRELIHEFYLQLIQGDNSKVAEKFAFIKEDKMHMNRQYSMLQMAIDIIINLEDVEYNKKLQSLFANRDNNSAQNNPHNGLSIGDYGYFMTKLIEVISQCDPHFQKDNNILDAWEDTKTKFLDILETHLPDGANGNHY